MSKIWVLFLTVLALALPVSGIARMYEEPKSFALPDKTLDKVERKTLSAIDPKRLLAEDQARGKSFPRPGPQRFAVTEDVAFDLDNSGTWQDVPDGRLWRLRIQSPGAVNHNLGITRFRLPEGAKLWIYDPARKQVEGPYTSRNRSHHGRLWTPTIDGDEIVVELFVPAGASKSVVGIGKVNKGYRGLSKDGADKSHGACNNDVICPEGDPWRDQIRSVARYTIDGAFLCTGQLVNNTALDSTPYFLSAYHCNVTSSNDDTLVFVWNFEAPVCGNQNGGSLSDTQTGAIFRASSAASDFLLVELSQVPDAAFNVFYTGWDVSGAAPATTVGIHHPQGDVKSISFNTNAVTSTAYLSSTVNAAANHWRVDDWEDGTTEGGSSGSCLWDAATGRCVGQLHGGFAFCNAPTQPDWYGKLSVSWTGGGTDATRLSSWLDPGNTGTVAIDGHPHTTTLDGTHYDFDGDGKADILWRATGGTLALWLMNGGIVTNSVGLGSVDPSWQIAGLADLDGDGKTDIVWRGPGGAVALWLMNGGVVAGTAGLGVVDGAWQIASLADLNGDGKADIVWRHTGGGTVLWLMNGGVVAGTAGLGVVDGAWQIAGLADLNRDGKADIVWRHTGGGTAVWLMNGGVVAGTAGLGVVDGAWQIAGLADLSRDGKADIVWRHTGGGTAVWLMNGGVVAGTAGLGGVDSAWQIAGLSDFDGGGNVDILWRHSNGGTALWLMNGGTVTSAPGLGTVDPTWTIQQAK